MTQTTKKLLERSIRLLKKCLKARKENSMKDALKNIETAKKIVADYEATK